MKKLILINLAIILVSCTTTKIVPVELKAPAPLVLPKLSADMLECLSDEAYSSLVKRDKMQVERRKTLRGIIESTQP